MDRKSIFGFILVLGLAVCGGPALAAQPCSDFDPEPEHFRALYAEAVTLGEDICLSYGEALNSAGLTQQFADFANHAAQAVAAAFAGKSFLDDLLRQMQHFSDLAQQGINKAVLPSFEYQPAEASDLDATVQAFHFTNRDDDPGKVDFAAAECRVANEPTCEDLFEDLVIAIEQYKKPYSALSGVKLSEQVRVLRAEWDRYFETARPQTLLDATLTTFVEHDHLAQSRLVGPMDRQWFVVHPSLVVENVSDAVDGDEMATALAVEWIGVNWWNKDSSPLGYPFGVSLTSVYADRASVDEVGHGLMLHFNNSLSIGLTSHGGDEGIFATVDALNLFTAKKQRWEEYRSAIKEIAEEKLGELQN